MSDLFAPPPPAPPLRIVLDTNAVLDWLVFDDPLARAWSQATVAGVVEWVVTDSIYAEWRRVLEYDAVRRHRPAPSALEAWHRHARPCREPVRCALRCADPDDQVFIDLAVAEGARWLLTKDRALLALARPAARLGVQVGPPAALGVDAGLQPPASAAS